MAIDEYDRIAIDFWCGADALKLSRRLPVFFSRHSFSADLSPLSGFGAMRALRMPGWFEGEVNAVLDKHDDLRVQHPGLVVFGVPLLWIATLRASGGRVSQGLVDRAVRHFRGWEVIVLPGDGVISKGGWYGDPTRILHPAGEGWSMIESSMDHDRQTLMGMDDLLQAMREAGIWR